MFVLNYDYVIGLGQIEYEIFLKLLKGEEDLTSEEERRVEQMLTTAIRQKKVQASRQRLDRNRQRQRPAGVKVTPRRPGHDEYSDAEEVSTESGFGVISR